MKILNLGILAHVDAGKTSLTERLLYSGGVIDAIGSVDKGSTVTDSLPLERQRKITIKSAVASFAIGDVTVNLIDTPGHPDFIAEVERVLNVLDGTVLVISAVESVQAQTRVLMRNLQRLHIPTLIFVNKIDRLGADFDSTLESIARRLTAAVVPMGLVEGQGTAGASVTPIREMDSDLVNRMSAILAENDDALLTRYLDGQPPSLSDCRVALAAQTALCLVHPVFAGSAITGAGMPDFMGGVGALLPAQMPDDGGHPAGRVFKIERGPAGEKIAFVRMTAGTLRTRDRVGFGQGQEGKVTAMRIFDRGPSTPCTALPAGRIGKLWGLEGCRIGDIIGSAGADGEQPQFARPTLESAVVPLDGERLHDLHGALGRLAEQDPLINLRQDDVHRELYVSLYGEVQKEVIQATLAGEFGIAVEFRETLAICTERPLAIGESVQPMGRGNPFAAGLGLRIEPGPEGSGIEFEFDLEPRMIPIYLYGNTELFRLAVEGAVRSTMLQGLCGWEVTDAIVTIIASGYVAPATSAADFRLLTPLVVMEALARAGTVVCEPIHRFCAEVPVGSMAALMSALARYGAVPMTSRITTDRGEVEGTLPAARVHEFRQRLPALTSGEGTVECEFDSYRAIVGPPPIRPRSDNNPLNRKEYLLHVLRHV